MKILIIALGTLKEEAWRSATAEYIKRLKPYAQLSIIEVREESFSESSDREVVKAREAELIKKHLPKTSHVLIAMDENGKNYSSEEFAKVTEKWSERGDTLVFILGGPLGLHESILTSAHHTLALSRLTFTHQMARVILLEQIYRAGTISAGKRYHY